MTREKVGVKVRFDDQLDRGVVCLRGLQVLADVTAGINDNRAAGCLVDDQVRGLREAFEIVLLENQVLALLSGAVQAI